MPPRLLALPAAIRPASTQRLFSTSLPTLNSNTSSSIGNTTSSSIGNTTSTSSTSSTSTPVKIAPESPKYIEIPRPPRVPRLFTPYVKGKLPKPKAIFPSVGPDKTSPEYLSRLTKHPLRPRNIPDAASKPEEAAYVEWKLRMAEKRRQNLREGIMELAAKKKKFDETRKEVREMRTKRRQELLEKKEREDVRLTLPSVLSTLRAAERFADPNREERLKLKAIQHGQKIQEKKDERKELVHDLYLHAESFILTEAQLEAAIESEFTEAPLYRVLPLTVSEMLTERNKGPSVSNLSSMNAKDSRLTLQTAGVLTGGRLPPSALQKLAASSSNHRYAE